MKVEMNKYKSLCVDLIFAGSNNTSFIIKQIYFRICRGVLNTVFLYCTHLVPGSGVSICAQISSEENIINIIQIQPYQIIL